MKKLLPVFILSLIFSLLFAERTYAQCPVCTAAALGGVGLARWLKIDDLVTGLWVGGALASTTAWTINWLNSKNIKFYGRKILVALITYGFVLVPFYYKGIITHPRNKYIGDFYLGIDKLVLGMAIGTIFLAIAVMAYQVVKRNNGGHAHFPFERIVFPIGTLTILSVIFYFITK